MAYNTKANKPLKDSCEEGFEFEPVHPTTGAGIGAFITVYGPQADVVTAHAQKQLDRNRERSMAGKHRAKPPTIAELDKDALETALVYTKTWREFEAGPGVPLPFSVAAARAFYTDEPWVRLQVIEQAQELGNFIRPSSTPSMSMHQPSSDST